MEQLAFITLMVFALAFMGSGFKDYKVGCGCLIAVVSFVVIVLSGLILGGM